MAVDRLYPKTWPHTPTRGPPLVYTADGTGANGDHERAPGCIVGLKESFKNQAAFSQNPCSDPQCYTWYLHMAVAQIS